MKRLLIYYSVSGQTEYIADMLQKKLDCDVFRIETEDVIEPGLLTRYYKGTKAMMSRHAAKLKPYHLSLDAYDQIIVGFPNWASNVPPAVKTFLEENKFHQKIYLYTTYVARGGSKCLENTANFFPGCTVENIGKFSLPKSKKKEELSGQLEERLRELQLG